MRSFAARSPETEWMDGDEVAPDVYAACVHDLGRVNTVTLTRWPTIGWLAGATKRVERFSLLDVGYGDGDMLRAVAIWARRKGKVAVLTGIDINSRSEPAAKAATPTALGIDYRTGDAFDMAGPRPDFIVCSQVTHHMGDAEIVEFLRWMEATAVRGWFVNDLHRHWIAFYGFKALSWAARWHSFVRHDGPVSVARSFRRADWERLIALAGIDRNAVTLRWHIPFRLCVGRVR